MSLLCPSLWRNAAFGVTVCCLAGCFSLSKGTIKTSNQEHVHVANYGWYLFHQIPLACGNASFNAWTPWVLFRDDVTMEKVQSRFMTYANGQNCDVSELVYTTNESVMLNIPGLNLPLPVPYLLTYREIQLSGVLTRKAADVVNEEDP